VVAENRRRFIGAAGVLLAASVGWAQRRTQPRVAWIAQSPAKDAGLFLDAFRGGLRDLGYREGQNLTFDAYWGDDSFAVLNERASALVASKPDVIVTQGIAVYQVRRRTATIPIVFGFSGDPVEAGMVKTLARPGGNLTGVSFLTVELVGKRVELVRELLPNAKRLAVVAFPQHPGNQIEKRATDTAARAVGLTVQYFDVHGAPQLADALAKIAVGRTDALMLFPVQSVISQRERIAAWAVKNQIPTISGWSQFADAGNLMTYGPNLVVTYRRLAEYVDRILRGASPTELPVKYPARVELVVNARAAAALGVKIPPSVLLRADRIIE
jgi:putative ABC transport system substrate-binding protein